MSTHECNPNASGASSPSEDSENSGSSADKGMGSRRRTRSFVIKRSISKAVAAPSHDNSIDDFVIPPPHAKKHTTPKASKKGGGRKKGSVKMTVSKARDVKKASWHLIQSSATFFFQFYATV
jgi:hypothetical protein